jgi:NADPH:quinone reductase
MKAITLDELGVPPALRADLPAPTPRPNDVLIRVYASSVNPVDNAIAAGRLKDMVEHEFPITLGRDYAGVVEQVGADVTRFSVGDEVFGFIGAMNPIVHAGTWAEFIVVPETVSIARKPEGLDLATAGAAPLAAITAMSAIDALAWATATRCSSSVATAGGVGLM